MWYILPGRWRLLLPLLFCTPRRDARKSLKRRSREVPYSTTKFLKERIMMAVSSVGLADDVMN